MGEDLEPDGVIEYSDSSYGTPRAPVMDEELCLFLLSGLVVRTPDRR